MRARQHKWGSLLPNREDTDGVRRIPLLRGSVQLLSSLKKKRKCFWDESSLAAGKASRVPKVVLVLKVANFRESSYLGSLFQPEKIASQTRARVHE